jgi:1,4-alpha-glucan branching enzyme
MFDVGRAEVQSFLISNAVYWLEKYHVDGLRVDAVASMLYLDCDKRAGEWMPNVYGDNRCLEAIAFFQRLNTYLAGNYPDVMTIAEESSAYAGVTGFADGGLGFSLKWNMGWMNDSLAYLATHPSERRNVHNRMNFSITYAFSEQYVLPVSHDEVVHGKRSLLGRSQGEYGQKFADVRTYLTYLMTHPGKKLTFMGCELGTFCEWDHTKALEWFLLDYDMHRRLQLFTARLNHFYLEHAQLWEKDADPDGFCWIDPDNAAQSVLSYRRRDGKGRELIVLLNFSAEKRERFLVGVPFEGTYREVFNTDATEFGGTGCCNAGERRSVPSLLRGYAQAVEVTLPATSAIVLECVRPAPSRRRS